MEYSSLCYTVGPYCLSILYIIVASANPKLPIRWNKLLTHGATWLNLQIIMLSEKVKVTHHMAHF